MRPESLSSDVSLSGSGWPGNDTSIVIDSTSGPDVSLSSLSQQIHHGQGLFVRVQRDSSATDRFAEFISFLAGEFVARIALVEESNDVATALILVVGSFQGTVEAASTATDGYENRL